MHPTSTATQTPDAGANCPSAHGAADAAPLVSESADQPVGRVRLVGAVERAASAVLAMSAGRAVSDAELLAHEADCRLLAEASYQRFEELRDPADREAAVLWLDRATLARKALSPAWKAARETQIQQGIANGTGCFFMDQGDAASVAAAGAPV